MASQPSSSDITTAPAASPRRAFTKVSNAFPASKSVWVAASTAGLGGEFGEKSLCTARAQRFAGYPPSRTWARSVPSSPRTIPPSEMSGRASALVPSPPTMAREPAPRSPSDVKSLSGRERATGVDRGTRDRSRETSDRSRATQSAGTTGRLGASDRPSAAQPSRWLGRRKDRRSCPT